MTANFTILKKNVLIRNVTEEDVRKDIPKDAVFIEGTNVNLLTSVPSNMRQ